MLALKVRYLGRLKKSDLQITRAEKVGEIERKKLEQFFLVFL